METRIAAPLKLPWFPWIGKKRPFYGWVIVAVGEVTSFVQGITAQGFATYLGPIQSQFGWNRALLAAPRSVTQVENAILGPLEGFLMDRLGPRKMVFVGTFIVGLGLILFGMTNSLWMYFLSNIIIAIGSGLQGLLVVSVAINYWFRRKRTLAQSVAFLGFTMAGVVGVPALVFLQTTMGWRESAIGSGLFVWAVGLPASLLLRRRPEEHGLLPDGDVPGVSNESGGRNRGISTEFDFTLRQALRTRAFWFLAIGQAMGNLGMGAVQVHLFLHLEQGVGLTRPAAALVWTVASITNVPARLLGGVFGDRLPKRFVLGISMSMMAMSVLVLGLATSSTLAFVYAVTYGIGWGARTPVMNAVQGDYFGQKSQGVIRGWLALVSLPLTIAAPIIAGYMADVYGTYSTTFMVMSIAVMTGAILSFLATQPKPPLTGDATFHGVNQS